MQIKNRLILYLKKITHFKLLNWLNINSLILTNNKINIMKKSNGILLAFLFAIITTLSSCEAIGGIFKAGIWVGVVVVVLIVGIILWIISKAKK